jgi:GAF domain-containing protein
LAESEELSLDLHKLHELLLAEQAVETALRRVADLAVATVPACDTCGVTLAVDGKMGTRVATDPLANQVDEIQYGVGHGPCIDAVHAGEPFRVDDMATETRWPAFCPQAAAVGVAASYSAPLKVGDEVVGALNLYSLAGRFGETDEQVVTAFSRQAAVVLANATTYQKARDLVNQLEQALESRDLIGQAKGIVMVRDGVDADRAFEVLKELSQKRNVKLRDVARQVVDTFRARS